MISPPLENVNSMLLAVALLMVRMLIALSFLPMFMGNAIPATVRISFVAGLSLCLLPLLGPHASLLHLEWSGIFPYMLKEAALGLILGLLSSLTFWALHSAGALIEFQAGLAMSTVVDPLSGQEDSLVGALFLQLFNMLFLVSGGLLALIGMLFDSYKIWPIDHMVPVIGNIKIISLIVQSFTGMIELVVKIAAPFVILMLVAELALGLLSRFAPQLNVFFLSLPIKIVILAILMLLFCSLLADGSLLMPNFSGIAQRLGGVIK